MTAAVAAGCALALAIPSVSANTSDEKQQADAKVQQLQDALEGTSTALATAYLALRATQAQLPAAQSRLATAQGLEKAADQHNDDVTAQLAIARANEARAIETASANAQKLVDTQTTLDNFAADVFQGGGVSELSVALGATSADDFATRVVLADTVTSLTNTAIDDLQNAKAEATAQKAYLTAVRAQIDQLKAESEAALASAASARQEAAAAQASLVSLEKQQAAYAAQVEARKAGEQAQLAAAEADQARLQALLLDQAGKAQAAEAARAAAARSAGRSYTPTTGGAGFLSYPANGPITSEFGMRFHPILHIWKLHTGTDFGVPCGTPVLATADGTLISAGWGGGDGNRIVIDHGIISGVDLATTYNHLSSFVVTSGPVKRGQLIAYSGTTGYSTGCHLHFETLENGQFVNPRLWI
ncbi:MAG: peptidoglycan DD-metalloendopeptidase family protein [Lapillicoccus sp.]